MLPELAVILAAGRGTRLRPLTEHFPKCLIPVNRQSILSRALAELRRYLQDVCVVGGSLADQIEIFLASGPNRSTHLCRNDDFAKTNNAYSLWRALQRHRGRSLLLLDGDLVFHPDLLGRLMKDPRENLLLIEEQRQKLTEEAMKVRLKVQTQRVVALGKEIPLREADGESIGIMRFSSIWSEALLGKLNLLMREERYHQLYYEDVIRELLPACPPVEILPVQGLPWVEIDTLEDLQEAHSLFR